MRREEGREGKRGGRRGSLKICLVLTAYTLTRSRLINMLDMFIAISKLTTNKDSGSPVKPIFGDSGRHSLI